MCGIAFIFNADNRNADPMSIRHMVHSIKHRGPDALTQVERGSVALGHAN